MSLSPFLSRKWSALSALSVASPLAQVCVPAELKPVTNGSQGSTVQQRAGRREAQARLRALGVSVAQRIDVKGLYIEHGPLVVRLVRVAPHALDGDNLEAALKRVRDGVAHAVGIDDRQEDVEYVADQRRGEPHERSLVVEVYRQLARPRDVDKPRKAPKKARAPAGVRYATIGGRLVAVSPNVLRAR